jgi:hypothetical protein
MLVPSNSERQRGGPHEGNDRKSNEARGSGERQTTGLGKKTHGTEPPPATTLVGLTLLEEELVTNLVEVEVTTLAGVELVTEVALVVELIDADVGVVVLELDVEELLEETDELEEVVEEVEVVLGRVDELSVLVLVVVLVSW